MAIYAAVGSSQFFGKIRQEKHTGQRQCSGYGTAPKGNRPFSRFLAELTGTGVRYRYRYGVMKAENGFSSVCSDGVCFVYKQP